MKRSQDKWLVLVVLSLIFAGCTSRAENKSRPAGTIRETLDARTGVRWFITLSDRAKGGCYDVVGEAPSGRRSNHGGLGCNIEVPDEPIRVFAGGGFDVAESDSFTFSLGSAPKGTKIVRVTLADGHVFSDSNPTPVWFVSWRPFGFDLAKIEALDSYGALIAERVFGQPFDPLPGPSAGTPRVQITPRAGPDGTRVTITGLGFDALSRSRVRLGNDKLGITSDFGGCRARGAEDVNVQVDDTGTLSGSFVIPKEGSCGPPEERIPLRPGTYAVYVGCVECKVAEFRLTG